MGIDDFWKMIETARAAAEAGAGPLHETMADQLASRSREHILDYALRFEQFHDALDRWDVWAAGYLIGGGCSDDMFIDFRASVIGLGREWYERVLAHPDELAEHPDVRADAAGDEGIDLFYEEINYVAEAAFTQAVGGGTDDFYATLERHQSSRGDAEIAAVDMGEDFDFHDDDQMRQRLPRLAALYLDDSQ